MKKATEKQIALWIELSESKNTKLNHLEVVLANHTAMSMEDVSYLIDELKRKKNIPFKDWKVNQELTDNPDEKKKLRKDELDFHVTGLKTAYAALDLSTAAIHYLTIKELWEDDLYKELGQIKISKETINAVELFLKEVKSERDNINKSVPSGQKES